MIKNIIRALRLPFISASALPFIFGSLIERGNFNWLGFLCGFIASSCAHLSSNLINDYADSKSGADWQDRKFYGFFGGSKLIQERVFSERFYFGLALSLAILAGFAVIALAWQLNSILVIGLYSAIIFLGWSYSHKPLQLSYRRLGEATIFLLFGPALVMGGYFIQTKVFPDFESFMLSLPFGFFTTAILFVNEVPDYADDCKAGKFTWVSLTGDRKAFMLYALLVFLGFLSVIICVLQGYLCKTALFALLFVFPAIEAAGILRNFPQDKLKLVESSKITINIQAIVSIILILSLIL